MVAIMLLIMLANRLKVAYPILLVLGGLAISFIPNMPVITIDPNLVLIIFLPPLLYADIFSISLKEMWKWRRIIFSFAFIVVFITAAAVAWVANMVFPGFSLALGFLLGGVVGSTDAVSASAIMRFVKVPNRISTMIESESLLNDASSLIVFRFAALVVTTGQLVWSEMALNFVWVVVGGSFIGLAIAWVMRKLHEFLPTDANMDVMLTLISLYVMYIIANELQASGVLAVVAGGMYMSIHLNSTIAASTRNKGVAVWDLLGFVLNGLAFMLIGLDLNEILADVQAEGIDLWTATGYGLLITGVLVVVRMLSAYGAVLITQIMKRFITVADERTYGARVPLVLGWAGMRGVLSLAVALSIPLTLDNGEPFLHRSLILYITFVVILVTLVTQGLTLPALIRWAKIPDFDDHIPEAEAESLIRKTLAQGALDYMKEYYKEGITDSFLLQTQKDIWQYQLDTPSCSTTPEVCAKYIAILQHQRELLRELNKNPRIDEAQIREFHRQLNLEEEKWQVND
ncbi:Na+/H+ antiporter [Capnocytophaga sp. HP1101]